MWGLNSESKRGRSRKTELAHMLKAYWLSFDICICSWACSCPHVTLPQKGQDKSQDVPCASKKVPCMPGASVCSAVASPWYKSSDFQMPVSFGSVCTSAAVLISTSKICSVFKSLLNNLNVPCTSQAESLSLSCYF